jgi:coenzyme F420-reducing hydrogenase delta subunit
MPFRPTKQEKSMSQSTQNGNGRIVVFTCNWNPYSALEAAVKQGETYPANVYPIRVMCLGRLQPGIILKALEKGASGVLLLGCPPDECQYESGNVHAEETFHKVQALARLLGFGDKRLGFDWVAAGDGRALAEKVTVFCRKLDAD